MPSSDHTLTRRRALALSTLLIPAAAVAASPAKSPATSASPTSSASSDSSASSTPTTTVLHQFIDVDGHRVFYREAGPIDAPVLLLLHGFPTSSHLFRDLMPRLATRYRVVAPDLPGFGLTELKPGADFRYTFDEMTHVVERFTEAKRIARHALYVFDIGAPIGWRLAAAHPERITAIVSQNGNAYEEGLSPVWDPIRAFWKDPSPQHREPLRMLFKPETTRWQYLEGVAQPARVAPDGYLLDQQFLERPGQQDLQLAILLDYRSNLAQYDAAHAYFRKHQPPLLAIWGANDPFFTPAGARAFMRDLPKAEIHLIEGAGHFALASHGDEVAQRTMAFLQRHLR